MKTKKLNNCLYGFFSGLILCIIGYLCSILPYLEINYQIYAFFTLSTILLGAFFTIISLVFRVPTFVDMLLRFVIQVFSFCFFWSIGGYTKIWVILDQFLFQSFTSASDNVSGLVFFSFSLIIISVSIITIIVKGVQSVIKKA